MRYLLVLVVLFLAGCAGLGEYLLEPVGPDGLSRGEELIDTGAAIGGLFNPGVAIVGSQIATQLIRVLVPRKAL